MTFTSYRAASSCREPFARYVLVVIVQLGAFVVDIPLAGFAAGCRGLFVLFLSVRHCATFYLQCLGKLTHL